jgi:putative flippase GtrA
MTQLIRFAIVGGLGTVVNLALFFCLCDMLGMAAVPVSIACFCVACSLNYVLNQKWSFASQAGKALSLSSYLKFVGASLLGLAVNLGVMLATLHFFVLPYKTIAQAAGIIGGFVFNFFASKYFVFKAKRAS